MSTFPKLKTGAVMQYPALRGSNFGTQVLRFLDGSEQRFRVVAAPLRRWVIQLAALDETEMNGLREFFRLQNGCAGSFRFTDPWDGADYPDCSLETDEMIETYADDMRGKTTLTIRENK